jgi:hypothetical protein
MATTRPVAARPITIIIDFIVYPRPENLHASVADGNFECSE